MADGGEDRRAFCLRGCQAVSAVALALGAAHCGGSAPAAPTPPVGGAPAPPEAPPPPASPAPAPQPPAPTPPTETGPLVSLPVVSSAIVNGALTVAVGDGSPLAATGGAALTQAVAGGITRFFLLARVGPADFSALNAVCTHEGCTVSRFASPVFVCPCHGSRYTTSGEVVQGPAPASLPRYPAEFDGGVLTVRF